MTDSAGFAAHNRVLARVKPASLAGVIMSVLSFFSQQSFDPEKTDVLTEAFDIAWERLTAAGSPLAIDSATSVARERLAKHILAVARMGEFDKHKLVESALSRLAIDPDGLLFTLEDERPTR